MSIDSAELAHIKALLLFNSGKPCTHVWPASQCLYHLVRTVEGGAVALSDTVRVEIRKQCTTSWPEMVHMTAEGHYGRGEGDIAVHHPMSDTLIGFIYKVLGILCKLTMYCIKVKYVMFFVWLVRNKY